MHKRLILAAALALSTSAGAFTVSLQTSGQQLSVLASGLGGLTITAWDIDIAYSGVLATGSVLGLQSGGALGQPNVDTIFDAVMSPGLIDAFEVSLLSNALVAGLQNGNAVTLLTLSFAPGVDLAAANFALVNWGPLNQISCAGPGNSTVACYTGPNVVPEPSSAALVALGLAGCVGAGGLAGRRTRRVHQPG